MAQITVEADAAAQTTGQYFLTPGGGVTQLPPEAEVFGKIDIVVLLAIPANEPKTPAPGGFDILLPLITD